MSNAPLRSTTVVDSVGAAVGGSGVSAASRHAAAPSAADAASISAAPAQTRCLRAARMARAYSVTVIVSKRVRAKRSGRYMSSTLAAGWANAPGRTARTM